MTIGELIFNLKNLPQDEEIKVRRYDTWDQGGIENGEYLDEDILSVYNETQDGKKIIFTLHNMSGTVIVI